MPWLSGIGQGHESPYGLYAPSGPGCPYHDRDGLVLQADVLQCQTGRFSTPDARIQQHPHKGRVSSGIEIRPFARLQDSRDLFGNSTSTGCCATFGTFILSMGLTLISPSSISHRK